LRKILIVGAGQSGLQLGLCLRERDYDVTVMSARTPDEIRNGWVTSTQCMFYTALSHEREHGLNLWDKVAPEIIGQGLCLAAPDSSRVLDWIADWDQPAQSIDQRVKMARWLELFEERGGNVIIHGVTTADLNSLAGMYDLVIVAAGKGELVQLFDRDAEHSPYTEPQRTLAAAYLHGMTGRPERPGRDVWFSVHPGICELIAIPGYTLSGDCDILYLSTIPGGPADRWSDRPSPGEQYRRMRDVLREYLPWEYDRIKNAELTDQRGTMTGAVSPVVRRPVGELPSGAPVLGMADVVAVNDPVTGQGSNNASKCAETYFQSIVEHGDGVFDRAWMQRTFDSFWNHVQHATRFTNTLLQPMPEHIQQIFGVAQENPVVAKRFVEGMNNPADFSEWFLDEEKAAAYLAGF
jgi:hypothetical protein